VVLSQRVLEHRLVMPIRTSSVAQQGLERPSPRPSAGVFWSDARPVGGESPAGAAGSLGADIYAFHRTYQKWWCSGQRALGGVALVAPRIILSARKSKTVSLGADWRSHGQEVRTMHGALYLVLRGGGP